MTAVLPWVTYWQDVIINMFFILGIRQNNLHED